MEKSEVRKDDFEFLFFMLSLSHPFLEALVTSKVQPPPFRVMSQYVFTSLWPGGLIVYSPSEV